MPNELGSTLKIHFPTKHFLTTIFIIHPDSLGFNQYQVKTLRKIETPVSCLPGLWLPREDQVKRSLPDSI
ncbi:MAG TPA: hypothetical protein ENJ81_00665 [Candidatus Aerophobetes bacterium]|nr:hypothetical protein [Candidatus Aerophobetes bacterium]